MMSLRSVIAAVSVAVIALSASSQAKIQIVLEEQGNNLVFTFQGTLDLTGMMMINEEVPDDRSGIGARFGSILSFPDGSLRDTYAAPSLEPFGGRNSSDQAGASHGDALGIFGDDVFGVPAGYVSGDFIEGTMIIENADFGTFGIIPGIYRSTFDNGSGFVLSAGVVPAPVPVPAGALLAGPVLAAMVMRRKRQV